MEIEYDADVVMQLLLSFGIGTAIGLEREFRSKAAGLRTMIMICLGSTIFTQISLAIGGLSPDRIASTVVTGIGFLGAGVIFRDGLSVSGITTATTIWISAALGMAVGAGEYLSALIGSFVVLIVLIVFENVKLVIGRMHQARNYKIVFETGTGFTMVLNEKIKSLKLNFLKERDMKSDTTTTLIYEVFGKEKNLDELNAFLKGDDRVKSYEY
jgi:putative Mg2+ transporter-C (MgtC) family protein